MSIEVAMLKYSSDTAGFRKNLEKTILGAIMIESGAVHQVIDILTPRNFDTKAHQYIYQAIMELYTYKPIDTITVWHQIRQMNLEGRMHQTDANTHIIGDSYPYIISDCISCVNSSANIVTHAMILVELSIVDQIIQRFGDSTRTQVSQAMGEEIIYNMMIESDKLEALEIAHQWMSKALPDDPFTQALAEINLQVSDKARKIRKKERLTHLINTMTSLADRYRFQPVISKLVEVLILTINEGSPSMRFDDAVYSLKSFFNYKKSDVA